MKLLLACAALVVVTSAVPRSTLDTSTKGLTKAAAAYVAEYQKQMLVMQANEEYTQRTFDPAGNAVQERLMNGDLWLTFVGDDQHQEWMAVHDFAMVDGQAISGRKDYRALLQLGQFESAGREFLAGNSRFNIGGIERNFTEPTLPLLVLEAKRLSGFSFDRKSLTTEGDKVTAVLAFEERDLATLIHDVHGRPVKTKGEFELDAATGEIRRTELTFKIDAVTGTLSTVYEKNVQYDIWVPATFTERYLRKTSSGVVLDRIECEAKYTNYRKWGATARIKK
jgi:hypothetical protein